MGEDGAQGRNRTADTVIFSHVLYQLSYPGVRVRSRASGAYRGRPRCLSSPYSCSSVSTRAPGTR